MSRWQLKVPVRDPLESVSMRAISELPDFLDAEDALVTRELLEMAFTVGVRLGRQLPTGELASLVEGFTTAERKALLDHLRKRAGLESIKDVEERENVERAQQQGLNRRRNDTRPPRVAISRSGALIDLNERDDDTASDRTRAATLAARRQAEAEQRDAEAQERRATEAAIAAQTHAELPESMRNLL